jgi:diguanylate cyclase (GGDEF)-like protein
LSALSLWKRGSATIASGGLVMVSSHRQQLSGEALKQAIQARQFPAMAMASAIMALCLLLALSPAAASEHPFDQQLDQIRALNRGGQVEQARQLLDQARIILPQASAGQQIEYQLLLSQNLGLRNQPEQALDSLDEVLALELDDLQRMRVLSRAASLASTARLHQRAFAYLRDALILVDRTDHPLEQSSVLGMAAQLLAGAGEVEQAIAYGARAVRQADRTGDLRTRCVSRQRLAAAWARAGQPERLEQAIDEACAICEAAEEPVAIAALATMRARLLLDRGLLDRAESAARQSIEMAEQVDYELRLPLARLLLALIKAANGEQDKAVALAEQQLEELRTRRLWEHLAVAHDLIARFHERQGHFDLAVEHMNHLIEARANHIEQDRARRLAYLEIAYELSQREQEIELLREQALAGELGEQALQQQTRLRQLSYLAGAMFGGMLLVLLVRTRRERHHFRRLSRRDSLTGLLNHTRFFEAARALLARSRPRTLCLVVADIDYFKQINDRFGHLVGDEVLKRVAARIREAFPEPAILGRVGGEEFAIALPECSHADAIARVEALQDLVNQARSEDQDTHITMSFGLASNQPGESIEALRERADQALYRAKNAGRDRWVFDDVNANGSEDR